MVAFERLLCGESGPVLTPALVELCMRVERASDPVAAEAALADAAGDLMPRVVRAFKWRRCFCTWLPPPDGEFYGLDVRRGGRDGSTSTSLRSSLSPRVEKAPPPPSPRPRAVDAPPPPPPTSSKKSRRGPPRARTTGVDRLATSRARLAASRDALAATNRKFDSARKRAVAREAFR